MTHSDATLNQAAAKLWQRLQLIQHGIEQDSVTINNDYTDATLFNDTFESYSFRMIEHAVIDCAWRLLFSGKAEDAKEYMIGYVERLNRLGLKDAEEHRLLYNTQRNIVTTFTSTLDILAEDFIN